MSGLLSSETSSLKANCLLKAPPSLPAELILPHLLTPPSPSTGKGHEVQAPFHVYGEGNGADLTPSPRSLSIRHAVFTLTKEGKR